uniref:Uncharacterized protein n=1 Tax=Peromyscus maniculatus bairdii TaxID=230844 RepID=A0A8C8W6S3_PERMB
MLDASESLKTSGVTPEFHQLGRKFAHRAQNNPSGQQSQDVIKHYPRGSVGGAAGCAQVCSWGPQVRAELRGSDT